MNFLSSTGKVDFESVFGELGGEFLEKEEMLPVVEVSRAERIIRYTLSGIFLLLVLASITLVGMAADLGLRYYIGDASFLSGVGLCSYLTDGVDYDNTQCYTLSQLKDHTIHDKLTLEADTIKQLISILPSMLQDVDVDKSPNVLFIRRTLASRLSALDIMDQFQSIRSKSPYQGEDIECIGFKISQSGVLSTSCAIYGGAVDDPAAGTSSSSRINALAFLSRLQSKDSHFTIVNYPSGIDISTYSSSEPGIKSLFSTKTSVDLTLQYVPSLVATPTIH